MDKKVYELKISEALEHVMPPLQKEEMEKLTENLIQEGCRDDLVVWNGIVVDGHNRYRICHENNIPFAYTEKEFENEAEARRWIINNQVGRRNLPDFVKCELVLPFEAELKAEAKKRQGARNDLKNIPQNSAGSLKNKETREELAEMAGVSRDTLMKAKKISAEADEKTKELLRAGEMSIHRAYTDLKDAGKSPKQEGTPSEPQLLGSGPLPGQLPEGATYRMPDSVYDIPPIEVYGNMPSDDMKLRGNVEMVHAKSDLQNSTDNYVRRISDVLRGMTAASVSEENIQTLREIVTGAYDQIMDMFNRKLGGKENE